MYCKYCGKQIADESKYCKYCGIPAGQTKAIKRKHKNIFFVLCFAIFFIIVLGTTFIIHRVKLSKLTGNWKAYSYISKDGVEEKITSESYDFLHLYLDIKPNHKWTMEHEYSDDILNGTWKTNKKEYLFNAEIEGIRVTLKAEIENNELLMKFSSLKVEQLSTLNNIYKTEFLIHNEAESPLYMQTGDDGLTNYIVRFKKQ